MARPVLVSQRKLNNLVKEAYSQSAWETFLKRQPTEKEQKEAITKFLNRARINDDTYEFNGVKYQVRPQDKTGRHISYKDIEREFPELQRVKRGKNEVYLNRETGKEMSRRQALNLYTQEVYGEKYQTEYSRKAQQRVNRWQFGLNGLEFISIPITRKKQNAIMGEWSNVVKQVIKENSSTPLKEFSKKHKGKVIITDVVTNTQIDLTKITFSDIIEAKNDGLLPSGNETPYTRNIVA